MKVVYCSKYWPIFWLGAWGVALSPYIFLRKELLKWPPGAIDSMIVHERVHLDQQRQTFLLWWLIKYIFLPSFRLRMETEAYLTEFRYCYKLSTEGRQVNLDPILWAKRITGPGYLWMISRNDASKLFRDELARLYYATHT